MLLAISVIGGELWCRSVLLVIPPGRYIHQDRYCDWRDGGKGFLKNFLTNYISELRWSAPASHILCHYVELSKLVVRTLFIQSEEVSVRTDHPQLALTIIQRSYQELRHGMKIVFGGWSRTVSLFISIICQFTRCWDVHVYWRIKLACAWTI